MKERYQKSKKTYKSILNLKYALFKKFYYKVSFTTQKGSRHFSCCKMGWLLNKNKFLVHLNFVSPEGISLEKIFLHISASYFPVLRNKSGNSQLFTVSHVLIFRRKCGTSK